VPIRVDLAARTVTLSPGALLAPLARRIGDGRGDTMERRWIGQAVHRRVLSEALATIPGYAVEKAVRLSFPVDGFTATLEGRLDGRYEDEDGTIVVDEVKSVHFAEELARLLGSPRLDRFARQLQWYLLAVSKAEGRSVRGRLVLADIETGETRLVPVPWDAEEVEADLVERVRGALAEFFGDLALAEAKAAEADDLVFPFGSFRPGQREMSAAVARAVRHGEQLLVEAPTGIGKTAAALFPMLVEALKQGRKLYVLTSKTTQQEIFRKTLEAIAAASARSVRLRAKERMCANGVVLCHEDHCPFAKDYAAKLDASGLLDRLLAVAPHLEPDFIFEEARAAEVCPFEVSLELAERADVVLGDYNYAFDPVVALSGLRDAASLDGALLLVDEIHNLVDRGRGIWSPELSETEIRRLSQAIGTTSPKTAAAAQEAAGEILALVLDATAGLPPAKDPWSPATELVPLDLARLDDVRLSMESLLVRHLADLRNGGERVPDDPVLGLYFLFAGFHDVARRAAPAGRLVEAFDLLASREGGGARLAFLCKDPSRLLGETFDAAFATVGMSATLSPPEFYRDLLGFDPDRTSVLSLPSPFPRENRTVVVASGVDTTWKGRAAAMPRIAQLVSEVADACPGNVLALFPSYRFVDDARALLPPLPGHRVLRPSDRSTELERNAVLDALREEGSRILLLAVSGGPFAEGVDYPGEMLHGVVVVSPALPQVRFEQERMRLYFEERYGRGFEYAYVIPGMTRVVQSAGRVIRSETDVGVIALVCRRFLQNPYRRFLPSHWYDESPEELASREPGETVRAFFAQAALREAAIAPALLRGSAPARAEKAAGPPRRRGATGRSRRVPGRAGPS
jgi:DNA excision repair protein ERCC-2